MDINTKLKLLQNKFKYALENTNPSTSSDTNYYTQKENKHISNNKQNIPQHPDEQNDSELEIYNLKSFRNRAEDSIIYNPNTPKDVMTHRYSKSKQIRKMVKPKNISYFEPKIMRQKRKKQATRSNFSSPNNSYLLKKTTIMKQKKKQNLNKSKAPVINQSFTYKFEGIDGKKVLKQFPEYLTETQKIEIINEKQIYYIGNPNKINIQQDDADGNYIWHKHDHIGFRYELLQKLGSGSFGQVIKALDHKSKEFIAIKIIKSKKQHLQLALNQINILMVIKEKDIASQKNCVKIKNFLVFRNHMCLIFQLLNISLYDLIKINDFQGIKMDFIRRFAIQILNALAFLKKNKIIHSDIKPENILLKSKTKTGIKLIDFGTSMFINQTNYDYIQSRYYRAPEVILGKSYSYPIDMWSVGCVLAELYTGIPLFSGDNEQQQISLIFQAIGIPSKQYLKDCKKCFNFFYNNFTPKIIQTVEGVLLPNSKPISKYIFDKEFLDFLLKIFVWDDQQRLSPLEALKHPWILEGLPKQIKKQHLFFIKQQLKNQYACSKKKKQNNQENLKQTSKKKNIKQNQRNSQLYFQKKPIQKHRRRRSDGIY